MALGSVPKAGAWLGLQIRWGARRRVPGGFDSRPLPPHTLDSFPVRFRHTPAGFDSRQFEHRTADASASSEVWHSPTSVGHSQCLRHTFQETPDPQEAP